MQRFFSFFFFILFLVSCGSTTSLKRSANEYLTYDGITNASRSDYYDVLDTPLQKKKKTIKNPSDALKIIKPPKKPSPIPDKLISISVTEDVPLKEVLLEISRMANLDVQISPRIDTSIIFSAKNKPLKDVLDNISEIANIRYKDVKGILIFEVDEAYVDTYNVSFLNLVRSTTASKSSSTSLSGNGTSSSQSSGSSFNLSAKTEDKLWEDLENGINQIISEELLRERNRKSKEGNKNIMDGFEDKGATEMVKDAAANVSDAIQQATKEQPPAAPNASNNASAGDQINQQQALQSPLGKNAISINRQGGLISVFATKKGHEKIDQYLRKLQKKMMAQVLIEVKIIEVTLDSTYRNGIDWTNVVIQLGEIGLSASTNFASNLATSTLKSFVLAGSGVTGNQAVALDILNKFGTVKTLISPRLNATNNQTAVLSRAENQVYFSMTIQNNFVNTGSNAIGTNAQQFTVAATPQTIPVGIDLTVHPTIDFDNREIIMNVRPSIVTKTSTVVDPGFAYIVASSDNTKNSTSLQNSIPQTSAKTFDTIVKIKDGDTMIMGGFTQHVDTITESGLPFLSEIPLLGMLFKKKETVESVVETVLMITATLIDDGDDSLHESDKVLYNKMANYSRKENL